MRNKDNCVNARVIHKLAIQTPENYLVFQYLNEIAKSHNLEWRAEISEPGILPPAAQTGLAPAIDPLMSFPSVNQNGVISSFPSIPTVSSPHAFQTSTNNNNMNTSTTPGNNVYNNYHNFNQPQFPDPPKFQDIPIPVFTPHEIPGFPSFPSPPASVNHNNNNNTNAHINPLINTNTTNHVNHTLPTFPSPPKASPFLPPAPSSTSSRPVDPTFLDLNFPSPPNKFPNNDTLPTPLNSNNNNNNSLNLNFPSPPTSGGLRLPPASDFVFPDVPTSNRVAAAPPPSDDSAPDFDELTARFEKLKKRDL
jgi:hypothetical protein